MLSFHPAPPKHLGRPFSRSVLLGVLSVVSVLPVVPGLHAGPLDDWRRMKPIHPKGYLCVYAKNPLQIDGRLDERAWQAAPWTDDFVDIEGSSKPPPRFRTRAKLLWDRQYFYVAAQLEEPHVWGSLTNHDAVIFQDPDFEVFIDPNGDSHNYYEFEINPLNIGWDLLLPKPYKDGGPALNSWEIPGLKTAVFVEGTLNNSRDRDRGWNVELAFPWSALRDLAGRRAPPGEGDQWRVNFSRVEWEIEEGPGHYRKVPNRKEDNWVWSPQGIIDMHRPEKWGYVQFTKKRTARFLPDVAAEARDQLQEIYYAEKEFHGKSGRYAGSLAELGLSFANSQTVAGPPQVVLEGKGFVASTVILRGGKRERWQIREDARVWKD